MKNFLKILGQRILAILVLNGMFWTYSLAGGFIFGVGPVLLTLTSLFNEYGWEVRTGKWSLGWKVFKANFRRGNILFYSYGATMAVIIYALFISQQLGGLWSLVINFLFFLAKVFATITFIFTMILEARYEIKLLNLFKLSFHLYFMDFQAILKIFIGVGLLTWIATQNINMIFFGMIEASIIIICIFSKKILGELWIQKHLKQLFHHKVSIGKSLV